MAVVLDSSFLIAYHNGRDVHHAAATAVMKRFLAGEWGVGILPEYVFLEVTTVLAARLGLGEAVTAGELLLEARELEFLPCSEIFLEAWDVFRHQAGELSFTDAAIVAVARSRDASAVATFDRDFRGIEDITVIPGPAV